MNLQKRLDKLNDKVWHVEAHTFEEYIALPEEERMNGRWYKKPAAMRMSSVDELFGRNGAKSEFQKVDEWLAKHYPIQFFFRDWLKDKFHDIIGVRWYCFQRWWWDLECNWKPYRVGLRKVIPKTYSDIRYILPEFMFQCIIEFVEVEKAGEKICWDSDEGHKQAWDTIQEVYTYVRVERPKLQEEYEKDFTMEIEQQIDAMDKINMYKIIEIYPYLWT